MPRRRAPRGETAQPASPIGANIRRARILKGLTQQELADLCGIHVARVSEAERGKHEPRLRTIRAFSLALNVPINQLLTRERHQG